MWSSFKAQTQEPPKPAEPVAPANPQYQQCLPNSKNEMIAAASVGAVLGAIGQVGISAGPCLATGPAAPACLGAAAAVGAVGGAGAGAATVMVKDSLDIQDCMNANPKPEPVIFSAPPPVAMPVPNVPTVPTAPQQYNHNDRRGHHHHGKCTIS